MILSASISALNLNLMSEANSEKQVLKGELGPGDNV